METTPAKDNQTYNPYGSLVNQIVTEISLKTDRGIYQKNEKLPSINQYSKDKRVARDTVEKAYLRLKMAGYIRSVKGKGYFVIGKPGKAIKVLLLFNKLSSYKKQVYDAVVSTLGKRGNVDIFIHQYDLGLLEECVHKHMGEYHYYVVMPHFFDHYKEEQVVKALSKIPSDQLILIDKDIPGAKRFASICQDFRNDIYDALNSFSDLLIKYHTLNLIFPQDRHHPRPIIEGVRQYCTEHHKRYLLRSKARLQDLVHGNVYIVLTEDDLAEIIKNVRQSPWVPGKDIGIISINETVFKELLDITVISTDFDLMGKNVGKSILNQKSEDLKNPCKTMIRKSL